MESKKNLVFLGMMGSGKTTIGKLISKKLRLNFFDIDSVIEKKNENVDFIYILQKRRKIF